MINCTDCEDTGWMKVSKNGVAGVVRCKCFVEYVPIWTKGPWKVTFPCGDIPHAAFIESAEGRHIVCVGEQHANALLMSLAPDLADMILDMDALGREHGHLCECEYCNLFARAKTLAGRLPK